MVRIPNKYKEQFRAIDQLRVITEQEGKIALFRQTRNGLGDFWRCCASARGEFLAGESNLAIDDESFRILTQSLRDLLLLNVPEAVRCEVRQSAFQAALALSEDWRSELGDIEVLAVADVELKVLAKLTLAVASEDYLGETRLPDWNREIIQADEQIALSCDTWRELAEQ